MNIAGYEIRTLETGRFALDGGAMFGIVPRVLWERTNPPDASHRIALALRVLLVRGRGRTILVDAGMGTKVGKKERAIYAVDTESASLEGSLAAAGIAPAEVTDVILTHLHFDHAGGATRKAEEGRIVPAFPRAIYHVQRGQFEWACAPSDRDRGSYVPDDFLPLRDAGCLRLLDGPGEILDGIHAERVDGHTPAHQAVRVSGSEGTVLFCGDLLPTASHVPLPYVMGYDLQPLKTVEEKKRIFARAVDEDWLLVLEHDPQIEAIRLGAGPRGAQVRERVRLGSPGGTQ